MDSIEIAATHTEAAVLAVAFAEYADESLELASDFVADAIQESALVAAKRKGGMSKYPGERDYLPGWDDRKELADIWQEHAPLPDVGLRDGVYDALIAVAKWGYGRRSLESE